MDLKPFLKQLKKDLKESRYQHTLGVTYTAAALAMANGLEPDQAELAGVLHDCAKNLPDEESKSLIREAGMEVTVFEEKNPALLHAKAGYILAKTKYGIEDEEIRHAILVHTTGCPGMSLLDKIIFVADYIEPGRTKQEHLKELREEAFRDLDSCLLHILEDTVAYLKKDSKVLDPMTEETYKYYKERSLKGAN